MAELNKAKLQDLLNKEAQGNLSTKEQQKLDDWYSAYDVDQKDLQVFKDEQHEHLVKYRLLSRIMEVRVCEKASIRSNIRLTKLRRWSAVAAIFIAVFSISLLWRYSNNDGSFFQSEELVLLSQKSGQGRTLKVSLEDGTEIWLNAGSKLSYPEHFDKQSREVFIEGEAFFQVAHDPARPFTVRTGEISARVLGTSFNVNAYPSTDKIRISVATGKVCVSNGQKTLDTLTSDRRIVFNKTTHNYTVDEYPASFVHAWREGTIRLEGASFSELASVVKNNYGYELRTDNRTLNKISFSTTFNRNDKIEDVMNVISRIPGAKYRIKSDGAIVMY